MLGLKLHRCAGLQRFSCIARAQRSRNPTSTYKSVWSPNAGGINEDVLARLRAAEEEASMLRRELAAAQAKGAVVPDLLESKPKRVDSVDKRETMFDVGGKKERASWLNESDVEFFTGAAPPGEQTETVDPVMQQTVQKRLVIGGLITLGLGAFAFIPTESLRIRPSKPLYFYVVPLLRIKDLLADCKPIIEGADWKTLRVALPRVSGQPNNARENLDNVVALLEDTKTAEKAQKLAAEFFEYLDSIDYNKYFDAMPSKTLTGLQNAQYSEFSGKALSAAQTRLDAFLALVPAQAIADARSQMKIYED